MIPLDFRQVPDEILEAARQVETWMAANNCARLRGLSAQAEVRTAPCVHDCEANAFRIELRRRDADLADLRAENAHLKNALALSDALRNVERNLPL